MTHTEIQQYNDDIAQGICPTCRKPLLAIGFETAEFQTPQWIMEHARKAGREPSPTCIGETYTYRCMVCPFSLLTNRPVAALTH
jgi:hypothetical protein